MPSCVAALDLGAGLLDRQRMLGDEDHVGAAGDPAHDGDPARVTPHHLDHHHAVVRLGRGVQAVDRLRGDCDGGVEAERVVGRREVVVDRLRHPDDGELVLGMESAQRPPACPRRRSQRARRATADAKFSRTRSTPPSTLYGFVRVVPRIVPPRGRSPEISRRPRGSKIPSDEPSPALPDADDVVLEVQPSASDRTNHRVQPGAVAAAGEDPDAHGVVLTNCGARAGWQPA